MGVNVLELLCGSLCVGVSMWELVCQGVSVWELVCGS